jgi:galactose mutarotase-like enzyme
MTDTTPADIWLTQPASTAGFSLAEGFWCTALRVRSAAGDWLPVFTEPPNFTALQTRATFYGNPLLFPYPVTIIGGAFTYRGQRYELPPTKERRVIHGVVRDRPWTLERTWQDESGSHVHASIDVIDTIAFPFPFRFEATYSLLGTILTLAVKAINLGDAIMPFGLGIHPYFPLEGAFPESLNASSGDATANAPDAAFPAAALKDLDRYVVQCNATHFAGGPTGDSVTLTAPEPPFDLRSGQTVGALYASQSRPGLHLVYTKDLPEKTRDTAGLTWQLTDTVRGVTTTIETGEDFRTMLLFSRLAPVPVVSPVIATCLSNAFNLAAAGYPSGMLELAPRESWQTWVRMTATHATAGPVA